MQELTDKNRSGLDKVYENLLSEYVGKGISLLEIGVLNGGSLLLWEKMLPDAKIHGFDILPRPESLKDSKVTTYVINQNDTEAIELMATEASGFDVIIDDGSHFTKETKNCFDTLWKHLKKGGIYVIEDWIIGIKLEGDKNLVYVESTAGMAGLVFDIVSRKTELGISAIEIRLKDDWQSYAVFKKGEV